MLCLQGKVKDIELKGHTDSVDQLCWDPKHADLIATASGDKSVRLWDARSKLFFLFFYLYHETVHLQLSPTTAKKLKLRLQTSRNLIILFLKNRKTIIGLLLASFIFTSFFMRVY